MKIHLAPRPLFLLFAALAALASSASAAPDSRDAIKPYPLDTCIVSDNELGSMGDAVSFVYEGREIKICCKPCEKKFLKNPEKYLAKLEAEKAPPAEGGKDASPAPEASR